MITIFIIQDFQQITTRVKPKAEESIVFSVNVLNRTVVTGIHKSTANISLAFIMPKSRFLELNVHALSLPKNSLFRNKGYKMLDIRAFAEIIMP